MLPPHASNILRYLRIIFFILLFSLISFLPAPLHTQYQLPIRIFYCLFLFILLLDKDCRQNLFSLQDWPLWVFLVSLFAGTVNATNKSVAFDMYFYLVIALFVVFYIGKGVFLTERDRKAVIVTICICSCLVAVIGFLELFFGKNILYEGLIHNPYYERYVGMRMMSTHLNPAVSGTYFLTTMPFIFPVANSPLRYLRVIGWLLILLSIFAVLFTFSRGVFLGFICLIFFYLLKMQHKKWVVLFCVFVMLFITICSFCIHPELQRVGFYKLIIGETGIVSGYRTNRIDITSKMLTSYPFCGVGLGHFRIRFFDYNYGVDEQTVPYEFMIPDNMYLSFLSETGIIGTSGFLIFIISLLRNVFVQFRDRTSSVTHSALVGLLVNMAAYELFYWSNPYMLFLLISGFIESHHYDK